MNSRISNKILTQTFRYNFCRTLSVQQQDVNKNTRAHGAINFRYKNGKHPSCFLFSNNLSRKTLCQAPAPALCINFQRNLSTDAFAEKDSDKIFDLPLPSSAPGGEDVDWWTEIANNISESKLVEFAQESLLSIHEATGLPWWATIALTAFMARTTVTLPLSIAQVRYMAKQRLIELEMTKVIKKLKSESKYAQTHYGWPKDLIADKYESALKKEYQAYSESERFHPVKTFPLILIQSSMWIAFSFATNNLCTMPEGVNSQDTFTELSIGGFGWITNLTEADPYSILPIVWLLVNFAVIEAHRLFTVDYRSSREQIKYISFQCVSLGLAPIALFMPAAANIYWLSSSLYGLLQALLLNSSPARRLFAVPRTDPELKRPYRLFFNNLKSRLRINKRKKEND